MTPRAGTLVAYWGDAGLGVAYVRGEIKSRWQLTPGRGKDQRVTAQRIAHDFGPVALPDGAGREQQAAVAAEYEAALKREAESIAVDLLWEIVNESAAGGEPLDLSQLAELATGASGPRECAVTQWALAADGLRFTRRGSDWVARDAAAVAHLQDEREQVRLREREEAEFMTALVAAVRGYPVDLCDSPTERHFLRALESYAVHRHDAAEAERKLAQRIVRISGIGIKRGPEACFRILRLLGRFDSDDANLEVLRHGLRTEFPPEVLQQAAAIEERLPSREGRIDLTASDAFSIDSAQTREIDDLLALQAVEGGGWQLAVHIADPTQFVEPGSPIDEEAALRGLTHYMPDLRIPMLPTRLSESAASLVVGQERPAVSFLIDLAADGAVRGSRLVRSIVRSRERLSYEEVDRRIEMRQAGWPELAAMANARRAHRLRCGAVIIDAEEIELHVDGAGRPILERIAADSPARWAVTEAMVLAGALAAEYCVAHGIPAAYRGQAEPNGVLLPPDGVWDAVAVRRARRGMSRAEVALEPRPHAGLGLAQYVQATSPLRRYQDLAMHRQIVAQLEGRRLPYDRERMQAILAGSLRLEQAARRAESAANEYWILKHLEAARGTRIPATVVELEPRPIVRLDETLLERPLPGLVDVELGRRIEVHLRRVEARSALLVLER